jgi:hypothetical protein
MVVLSGVVQKELAAISASLSIGVESADPDEWLNLVRKTNRQIDAIVDQEPAISLPGGES